MLKEGVQMMLVAEGAPDVPIVFPVTLSHCHNAIGSGLYCSLLKTFKTVKGAKQKRSQLYNLVRGN